MATKLYLFISFLVALLLQNVSAQNPTPVPTRAPTPVPTTAQPTSAPSFQEGGYGDVSIVFITSQRL